MKIVCQQCSLASKKQRAPVFLQDYKDQTRRSPPPKNTCFHHAPAANYGISNSSGARKKFPFKGLNCLCLSFSPTSPPTHMLNRQQRRVFLAGNEGGMSLARALYALGNKASSYTRVACASAAALSTWECIAARSLTHARSTTTIDASLSLARTHGRLFSLFSAWH